MFSLRFQHILVFIFGMLKIKNISNLYLGAKRQVCIKRQVHKCLDRNINIYKHIPTHIYHMWISSVVNTICLDAFRNTHVIICEKLQFWSVWRPTKDMAENKTQHRNYIT